ncbi:hypothetical protein PYW07_003793 [Mythimna separata]|uniref:Uncharacterized protein n=1 Tax=Mythimna separata TaxID=271217 RepID=A0AAD7YP64_MYTSE|nr:hypothetical protein PYW07_003793 [Mythimna separata]
MSIPRSPPGGGIYAGRSESYPNLSESHKETVPPVTQRNRRKSPDNKKATKSNIAEIKEQMSEMMELLKSSKIEQAESINKLSLDVAAIKAEVGNISSTMQNIILENKKLKDQLSKLSAAAENTEKKVEVLEADVNNLKNMPPASSTQLATTQDEIFTEIHERNLRAKNIIVVGIPEPQNDTAKSRQDYDKAEILRITGLIYNGCPQPTGIFRLGKYKSQKSRAIKVCFSSEDTAKNILRSRNKVDRENIKIFSDQTPYQRKHLQNLKEVLQHRTSNGESGLSIKYIKGIPKIVSSKEMQETSTMETPKN